MTHWTDEDQVFGKKILKAREFYLRANKYYEQCKFAEAFYLYMKVIKEAPQLIRFPLSRKPILSAMLKCPLAILGVAIR